MSDLREDYISHITTAITAALQSVAGQEVIQTSIHDEFSYNNEADLNITVKFLPGQIQSGIVQYPGELIFEYKSQFKETMIAALDYFAVNNNETSVTLDGTTYREYYATQNVIGTFVNNGIDDITQESISFTLIMYNNLMGLDFSVAISLDGTTFYTLNWLTSAITYTTDTNSTGSIGLDYVKSLGKATMNNYTFTFIPNLSNTICRNLFFQAVNGNTPNKKYVLSFADYDPSDNDSEATISCIVYSASITQEVNGLPIMQVTFVRGDF